MAVCRTRTAAYGGLQSSLPSPPAGMIRTLKQHAVPRNFSAASSPHLTPSLSKITGTSWDHLPQSQSLNNGEYLFQRLLCWLHSQTLQYLLHHSSVRENFSVFSSVAAPPCRKLLHGLGLFQSWHWFPFRGSLQSASVFIIQSL